MPASNKDKPFIRTTGTWVELDRNRPHGKLTQNCIRNLKHTGTTSNGSAKYVRVVSGTVVGTSEHIKSGRLSLASSRSTANTASKKQSRFAKTNGHTDAKLTDTMPLWMRHGAKSTTTLYVNGPAATDTSNVNGLSARIKARG